MTASPIYDEAWWQRRSESRAAARTLLGTLKRLEKAAARYARSSARWPHSDHLIPMLHTVQATIREALEKGASLGDVAGACGLVDPPARLGLDDATVDLPIELAMSRRWTA